LARLRAWQSKECVRGVLEQLAQIAPERAERRIGGVRDFFKAFHRGDWRLEIGDWKSIRKGWSLSNL
jgi:hypothetical protein